MTQWHRELSELKCPLDSKIALVTKKREVMSDNERRERNNESHRRLYAKSYQKNKERISLRHKKAYRLKKENANLNS